MQTLLSILVAIASFFASLFSGLGCGGDQFSDEWKAMVKKNYDEFIAEVDGDPNKIPMIISTDQHGAVSADCELYKYVNEITDWSKISKIINLGDTVEPAFNVSDLVNYRIATECLPAGKRIEVIGNHDRFFVPTPTGTIIDSTFFPTAGAVRSEDKKAFTVTDEQFGVRYLAVDTKVSPWNYGDGVLLPEQADFIIKELEKQDDLDIVMLSHPYLFKDKIIRRNGSTFTGSEFFIGTADKYTDVKQSFVDMLAARKNKTAGVLLDCEGNEHPYDFTACTSDFLMALHGHHHTEGYETKDGITEFLFQSMTKDNAQNTEPWCFYFAYIDKEAKTFKCWKNIDGYEAWEFSIA